MLSFQTMNIKRRRDDDSDSEDDRYMKKSRPWSFEPPYHGQPNYFSSANLAFRPSITPSPPSAVPGLEAMTPAESEQDADSPQSLPEEPDHDPALLSSPPRNFDYEMDMDDDDFDVRSQPPESPFVTGQFLRPAMLNSELFGRDTPLNASSRIPTPIYPNFNRGMNGLGYPSSGLAGGMSMSNGYMAAQSNTAPLMQPPPPRKQANIQQQTVDTDRARRIASPIDRSRRMPSPISEDEDIPDTPTALTQSQLSRLTVTTHPHLPSDQMMETETCGSPLVPPTPTRGRKRSGALTGMGRFSMGYRDDCEKCRQRVPGHYSHFLPQ